MKSPRIIFMGTAEFAVASLGSLLMNGFDVACVVTAPDKPAGRGRKIAKSAVKEFAEFSYLPVLQPDNLKDPGFIDALKKINADMFVVVAFRMLPEAVWKMPSGGTINLHASYLPHYRGAAPVNRVIMNGETVTGVSTFLIDEKIDTGRILMREEVQIFPFENAGDLHDRLMKAGARLLIQTIMGISDNSLTPVPQSELLLHGEKPKDAPKIFPADCLIDWNLDPVKIHNQVRGLAPYPGARSYFLSGDRKLSFKLYESQPEFGSHDHKPGTVISDGRQFLKIALPGGFLSIINLQIEGKNRMYIADFLRGFNISGCSAVS